MSQNKAAFDSQEITELNAVEIESASGGDVVDVLRTISGWIRSAGGGQPQQTFNTPTATLGIRG